MLERFNQEIKRREEGSWRQWRHVGPTQDIVRVARAYAAPPGRRSCSLPNDESCLRLVRALAVETHEDWLEANRYLNMIHLKENKRERIQKAA